MPQTASQPAQNADAPTRVRWTRAACEGFVAQGLLVPGKYELIDGQILTKMGQKRPHTAAVALLFAWCLSVFGARFVSTKASLDARAEIAEYWVLDIAGRALIVHREPDGDRYRSVARYADDEAAATLARPDAPVTVETLLPPTA